MNAPARRALYTPLAVLGCLLMAALAAMGAAPRQQRPAAARPAGGIPLRPASSPVPGALGAAKRARAACVSLPLRFEPNRGQTDPQVKFLSRGRGHTLFLTANEAVLSLGNAECRPHGHAARNTQHAARNTVLRMQLVGANTRPAVAGVEELPGKVNYLRGSDPRKWRTNLATYARVRYQGVYPGVDLVYYGDSQRRLEYDFVLAPGADPRRIRLAFTGAEQCRVEKQSGDLVLRAGGGGVGRPVREVRFRKPVAYQEIAGRRVAVAAGWSVEEGLRIQGSGLRAASGASADRKSKIANREFAFFRLAAYDHSRPLVVDPTLVYYSNFGGATPTSGSTDGNDYAASIAVDAEGCAYVAGYTESTDFPAGAGARQTTYGGGAHDAFVTKLDATGSSLVYCTYLGGSGDDQAWSIALDGSGCAYVAGVTGSYNFPVTAGAFDTTSGPMKDAFVAKLNATGSALVYSTCLGSMADDAAYGIAVDAAGCAYVTGATISTPYSFPVTPGAYQTSLTYGGVVAFLTKFNASGSALVYSTYLGWYGGGEGRAVAVDGSGCAYVTGEGGPPATAGSFQTVDRGYDEGFVAKVNAAGTALLYSTYLGGSRDDESQDIAIDADGCAYVVGYTESLDFPVTEGAFQRVNKGGWGEGQFTSGYNQDAFVAKVSADGSALAYSTYLGSSADVEESGYGNDRGYGIAVDAAGCAYVTGVAEAADFPVTPDAYQGAYGGGPHGDAFVTKLSPGGGALDYSTFLGGTLSDGGRAITLDGDGFAFMAGWEGMHVIPPSTYPGADVLVAKFSLGSTAPGPGLTPTSVTSPARVPQRFTSVHPDPAGSGAVAAAAILVNGSASTASGLCATYDAAANRLYLYDDAGATPIGGFAPATAHVISNSHGSLNCAATSISRSDGFLTIQWSLTPDDAWEGTTQNVYLWARTVGGVETGWTQYGTWSITHNNHVPTNDGVAPVEAVGTTLIPQTLSTTYSDGDGVGDISVAYLLVTDNPTVDSGSVCVAYDSVDNTLGRADVSGTPYTFYPPESDHTIMLNSRADLNCAQTSVSRAGNTLTIHWSITPKERNYGPENVHLRVVDIHGADSGWQRLGTWQINPPMLSVAGTSTAPSIAGRGESGICMERLHLTADVRSVPVTALKVRDKGTIPYAEVALRVYKDADGSGTFDAGLDTDITPAAPAFDTATKTWTFTFATPLTVTAGTPVDLFLVVDVSAATVYGKTVQLNLAAAANVTVSGCGVWSAGFPIDSTVMTIANRAPVAGNDAYSTDEDTALTVAAPGVLANDTDAEGDPRTAVKVANPGHGTLTLNANGSFTYTPAANWNGTDTFTYQANDGTSSGNTATATITVSPVNDAPAAAADFYSTNEDTPLTVAAPGVLGNDTDAEGSALTAALAAGPAHGTLTLDPNGSFTYTPAADWSGTDTFTYRANDGTSSGNTATVTLTVNPVNDAPAAAAESYSTNEDTPLTVAAPGVLGNDTDTEGSALTAALAAGPAHGTLTLNANGSFTYTPAADWSGTDTFTYRANDGTSSGNTATVTLTVSAVNDAPVANNDSYGTGEETALTVAAPGVLGNDTDAEGDALTAALVAGPAHGTLTLSTNGSFTYAPAADWNGTDTFTYKANDTKADSGVATVSIRVGPANDAPAAGNDSFGTNEDVALTVAAPGVLANDNDTDHDPLTARLIAGPAHGTLALNADGSFTYTPAGDWSGTDTFTYQANDGTADSAVATAGITVSPVNDRPVATEDSYGAAEDTTLTVAAAGVLENDTDIEGDPLTAALVAGPAHGTLALNPDGSFTYRPAANWNGTDTFTYRATDGRVDSATATVRIVVSAANDAPVAANDSYVADEDSTLMVAAPGVLANDTDLDGNVLTAVLVNGPAHGTLTLNPKGYFIYTPAANWNGTDTFTYKASDVSADSTATVSITVRPAGDAPAAANDSYATDEDTALAVAAPGVLANDTDADGDALTAARVAGPAHGALTLNSNGSFAYTPAANWFGTDSFTYRASDGKGNSSTATVTLIVRSINDPPVTANDAYTTHEDTALIVAAPGVLANDTDVDSGTRTAVLVAGPAHGTLALYGSGSFVYRPAANWHGTDTFSYKAREGAANGNVAVVTITVTAANDRPAAAGDSYTTDEDAALMVAAPGVLANDTDADGDALTAARATGPAHGTLALSANGSFTYTPAANWYGTDSFTYQANDGSTSSLPARVNITIRPVVDLSYVTASPLSVTGGAAVVGRVGLGGPAPAGGFTVSLSSSHASVTVPASVTLPAGQSTATFAVTTAAVAADTPVTLTAAGGGTTRTGRLTVKALVVNYLTVSPTAVVGGGRATGRVTLNRPVPAGEVTVALSSGDAAVVVPASVSVVAGTATAVFPITTGPVPANTPVVIAATCGGVGRTATITVKPPTPQMLVVSPATITGGYQCLGSRVLLNAAAPAGGFAVALESGNPAVASVPATVVVPAGQTRGNFTITTTTVSATTAVTIRAAAGGVSRTGVLTVKPRVVR